ncbi:MAG: dihydrodipicolinate synthase family protein [Opitutaceae bacterium]|nr:dihydrodipicolinate synthase family protein [Opitutaceae bacterium]
MKTLDSESLHGLWSAVPTPFRGGGEIDYGALRENCFRLAKAGVDGIYTTDSDGEFYAIEWPEFKVLAAKFGGVLTELKLDAQMGVTWINTRGVIDRIKASVDAGISTVHVALPFFMPMPAVDVRRFFADLATAVPQARWVYYAHPNCLPLLKGKELAELAAEFPDQLIGTKLNAYELNDLTDVFLLCPKLAHFGGERNLLFASLLGAKGCYSYWVNVMPKWMRTYVHACLQHDYRRATEMYRKLCDFENRYMPPIRQQGYRHGIVGKARGSLRNFLVDDGSTRGPYQPVPPPLIAALKSQFEEFWKTELADE